MTFMWAFGVNLRAARELKAIQKFYSKLPRLGKEDEMCVEKIVGLSQQKEQRRAENLSVFKRRKFLYHKEN